MNLLSETIFDFTSLLNRLLRGLLQNDQSRLEKVVSSNERVLIGPDP